MDFSKFSDTDFEVKGWVNGALAAHKESQATLDAHASTLVMKLQLFIQEVNGALEETSNAMLQNLPRVVRDVEAVRQEATLLREQMHIVKEDIKKVERETGQSMQTLVELDAIKGRMHSSLEALQEADNWTTLSSGVEQVFSSQDIAKIAEKLAGMQQSLHVLHDVPDFNERWRFLENLKDRLEALLSPLLITSFTTHSTGDALKYVQIFSEIERLSQLKNYYIGSHKGSILQLWSSLRSVSSPLSTYLSTFYEELLSKWHAESLWCHQVSLAPLSLLPPLFSQSLEALSPPLSQCLLTAVQGASSPSLLLESRQASLRFVSGLEREVGVANPAESAEIFRLVECVHSPFCQLLVRYPTMETHALKHSTQKWDTAVESGLEESVSEMSRPIPWVFQYSSEAVERCTQLTGGWGFNGLIKTLQGFLVQHVSHVSTSLHQVRRLYALQAGEEWIHVFNLIQLSGDMLLRTHTLAEELNSAIINSISKLQQPSSPSSPFGYYDYLAVYHPEERTAAMQLLNTCQKGKGVWSMLSLLSNQIQSLNEQAHSFAFDVIFHPLKEKLQHVPNLQVWTGATSPVESPRDPSDDLPHFSLSPLPYITEIGDYLLTLPRQLEPFTSQSSPALSHALQQGILPFPDDTAVRKEEEGEPHPSDEWLGAVARGTMITYSQQILKISCSLSPPAAHQLATDIAYLCNVLTALGQVPTQQLVQLENLLKATELTEFEKLKDSTESALYLKVKKLRTWQ